MVATFNGWEDMPELEREVLERWEEEQNGGDQGDHLEGGGCLDYEDSAAHL